MMLNQLKQGQNKMFQMDRTINKELLKAITPSSESYDKELGI
jgi:hypothetical protein